MTARHDPALALRRLLDRLADHYDREGKHSAPIQLWADQYRLACRLLHFEILSGQRPAWRGHPLICAEESKP